MRGQILGVENGEGLLLGGDDERRRFAVAEWRGPGAPTPGQAVDFVDAGQGRAASVYPIAPGASPPMPAARASSSFVLGATGVGCLALGFIIPFIPTLAALILGVIGAGRAQEERDANALVLSRIAWIGALVLFGIGLIGILILITFFGALIGFGAHVAAWPPIPT